MLDEDRLGIGVVLLVNDEQRLRWRERKRRDLQAVIRTVPIESDKAVDRLRDGRWTLRGRTLRRVFIVPALVVPLADVVRAVQGERRCVGRIKPQRQVRNGRGRKGRTCRRIEIRPRQQRFPRGIHQV